MMKPTFTISSFPLIVATCRIVWESEFFFLIKLRSFFSKRETSSLLSDSTAANNAGTLVVLIGDPINKGNY